MDVNICKFTQSVFPELMLRGDRKTSQQILLLFPKFAVSFLESLGEIKYEASLFATKGFRITGSSVVKHPGVKKFHLLTLPFEKCDVFTVGCAKHICVVFDDKNIRYFSMECVEEINASNKITNHVLQVFEYFLNENAIQKRKWAVLPENIPEVHGCFTDELISYNTADAFMDEVKMIVFNDCSSVYKISQRFTVL